MKVDYKMVKIYSRAYSDYKGGHNLSVKAGLKAVLEHISQAGKKVGCNHIWITKQIIPGDINSACEAICKYCGNSPVSSEENQFHLEKELIREFIKPKEEKKCECDLILAVHEGSRGFQCAKCHKNFPVGYIKVKEKQEPKKLTLLQWARENYPDDSRHPTATLIITSEYLEQSK